MTAAATTRPAPAHSTPPAQAPDAASPAEPLCECGSGLRPQRCCKLPASFLEKPAETPKALQPLIEQAVAAQREAMAVQADPEKGLSEEEAGKLRLERYGEMERLCLEILELMPTHPGGLTMLTLARQAQGNAKASEALLRRLVRIDPNYAWAVKELALLLLRKNALWEAEVHARNAVRIAPTDAQSHNLMGMIMTEQNRPRVGEHHYRRVLELRRPDPDLYANLALNLKNQGRMEESRDYYGKCVEAAPRHFAGLLGWSRMEETDRNFAKAAELLDRAEKLAEGHPSILLQRAIVCGRLKQYDEALEFLARIEKQRRDGQLGPGELLEKGRLLDKMGRYDEAWTAWAEGKRRYVELSGNSYMAEHAQQLTRRLERFFQRSRLSLLPRANARSDVAQPLFIIGFMRSGTTMVEQTLSAHPQIVAGDELTFIGDITGVMPRLLASPLAYPEALADLWLGDQLEGLDNLRDFYLQRARQLGIVGPRSQARWFTDKMPLNETHLGLISMIFPQSPVIHVVRHPLDVILSVFSNHMTHGFYCAYSLESAAKHYALIYTLIQHYRREVATRYLAVRYEDIVADQEGKVRELLTFVGERFDRRCLSFHENKRYARTASYAQVTEKLYDSSVHRYRHYLKQMEPILETLRPAIELLGYSV